MHPYAEEDQNASVVVRLAAALERLGEYQQHALRAAAFSHGLSPLQVKILAYIQARGPQTPGALAHVFAVTRPTISDAVKQLHKKDFLHPVHHPTDARSKIFALTDTAQAHVQQASYWATALPQAIAQLTKNEQGGLLLSLLKVLERLEESGALQKANMCLTCQHYQANSSGAYCLLLQRDLQPQDHRLSCPEHNPVVTKLG